ncbi:phosphodiesterase [Rhodobacteraceae bacterium NNCM2]|nr:phosphodiesterase [Coraliihabitans acroporae]
MLLAQITDLHMRSDDTPLSGKLRTRPFIAAAVDAVNKWATDAVFVTGDLTDIGTAEEYSLLRAELDRLDAPYFVIPGNHDRHEELRAAFADHAYLPTTGPLNWVIDEYPVRLIGLDTVVPGKGHGELAAETLEWLSAQLEGSKKPTIVGLHHPPFPTGILGMDIIKCLNGDDLAPILARHRNIERVIAGHHHRPVQIRWGGTLGQISPSVAHQVVLDFEPRDMAEWILEPPAMMLHRWSPDTGVISHTAYIGEYDGPHSFKLDPDYPGGN